jgi:hypothetical protein
MNGHVYTDSETAKCCENVEKVPASPYPVEILKYTLHMFKGMMLALDEIVVVTFDLWDKSHLVAALRSYTNLLPYCCTRLSDERRHE